MLLIGAVLSFVVQILVWLVAFYLSQNKAYYIRLKRAAGWEEILVSSDESYAYSLLQALLHVITDRTEVGKSNFHGS
jgi:hypothetical protein